MKRRIGVMGFFLVLGFVFSFRLRSGSYCHRCADIDGICRGEGRTGHCGGGGCGHQCQGRGEGFYEKAQELGIVLDIHTGFCWVPPGKSKYALPVQLDDVARDFPELRINAFHMGYPYCDDLNMVAMAHPNVYVCLSLLVPWAITAPRKFGKILGEALRWVGPDKITWGTDYAGFAAQISAAVRGLRDFQIPEDLQMQYGYPPLTEEDKAKIFGGNLGRLLGIDTSKRRTKRSQA